MNNSIKDDFGKVVKTSEIVYVEFQGGPLIGYGEDVYAMVIYLRGNNNIIWLKFKT